MQLNQNYVKLFIDKKIFIFFPKILFCLIFREDTL